MKAWVSGRRREELAALLLLGLLTALSVAVVLHYERGLTFVYDEPFWLQTAGLNPVGNLDSLGNLLEPYGGHLIAGPYLAFKAVLRFAGLDYDGFKVPQILLLVAVAWLLFAFGRRRVGPLLAVAPALVLLFLGAAWDLLIVPMVGIQTVSSIALGLAAVLALERRERAWDLAACALLAASLACFSYGMVFLAGAATMVALRPGWRGAAWVVAIPAALYLVYRLWALQFGGAELMAINVVRMPAAFVDSFAAVGLGMAGLIEAVGGAPAFGVPSRTGPASALILDGFEAGYLWRTVLFAAAFAAACWLAVAVARRRGIGWRALAPYLVMLATLWVLHGLALSLERPPASSRYVYPGALLVLMLVLELTRGVRTTPARATVVLGIAGLGAVLGLSDFRAAHADLGSYSERTRAAFAAFELAGPNADRSYYPPRDGDRPALTVVPVVVGPYLDLVERYGSSPAFTLDQLREQPAVVREEADRVLARTLRLRVVSDPGPAAGCRRVAPAEGAAGFTLPPGGARLLAEPGSRLWLRRFGDAYGVSLGVLGAGPEALVIPPDRAQEPWQALLRTPRPLRVCAL